MFDKQNRRWALGSNKMDDALVGRLRFGLKFDARERNWVYLESLSLV